MSDALHQALAIVWRDVVRETRTRELLVAMTVFGVLVVVIFNFALDLHGGEVVAHVVPGVFWAAVVFAAMLGLGRAFALERDRGSLEGLLLCPVDRGTIFLGKLLSNFLFILLAEALVLPPFMAIFGIAVLDVTLPAVVFLATVALAAVGTLFGAMAVNTRARDVLLPILMLPVLVPVIIAAVKATGPSFGVAPPDGQPWLQLLVSFDCIFVPISYIVFEHVVEE